MGNYKRVGRRVCALPEALVPVVDRETWLSAIRKEGLFTDGGSAGDWASATKTGVWVAYRRWLLHLHETQSLAADTQIADRVTPAAVMSFIKSQQLTSASSSVASHMIFLGMALRVMAPNHDWAWLNTIILNLKRLAKPAKTKVGRIVASSELVDFGLALIDAVGMKPAMETWQEAVQCRDGLIIALLAARPLRRRNFLGARIGENLIERSGSYWFQFSAEDTKNKEPIEQPIPVFLNEALRHYLGVVRPFLVACIQGRDPRLEFRPAGDHLWVSKTGGAMVNMTFTGMVKARTKRQFGLSINPHLFRDCLATSQATEDPDHVATTRLTLGHRSSKTAERHYNHAQGLEASRRMQAHVLALRRGNAGRVRDEEVGIGLDDDSG